MYNLPTDTCINGLKVYHEGNHADQDNPHNNYINKFFMNTTGNTKDINKGKYAKIATINCIKNNNFMYHYEIDVLSTKYKNLSRLIINIANNKDKSNAFLVGNRNLEFAVVQSDINEKKYKADVYLKINSSWTECFYRLVSAKCDSYLITEQATAFNSIEIKNSIEFINNIENNINIEYEYDEEYITLSSLALENVVSNTTGRLELRVEGLTKDSFVSIIAQDQIPDEFVISSVSIPYSNTIYIKVRNVASYTKTLNSLKWNIRYKIYKRHSVS